MEHLLALMLVNLEISRPPPSSPCYCHLPGKMANPVQKVRTGAAEAGISRIMELCSCSSEDFGVDDGMCSSELLKGCGCNMRSSSRDSTLSSRDLMLVSKAACSSRRAWHMFFTSLICLVSAVISESEVLHSK